jgi:hypothetical protein
MTQWDTPGNVASRKIGSNRLIISRVSKNTEIFGILGSTRSTWKSMKFQYTNRHSPNKNILNY